MGSVFSKVGGAHPRRNKFNLSYSVQTTADMGILYPAGMPQMLVPGDSIKVGHEVVAQMQSLKSPMFADISIYFYDFFVPFRLLWDDWETFITRGQSGDETPFLPKYSPSLGTTFKDATSSGSLWDYFGFPVSASNDTGDVPYDDRPLDFLWRAYWFIWNEYFRDENLMKEVVYNDNDPYNPDSFVNANSGRPVRVCWGRDYFTSSLPFQQRGTPVAIPVVSSGISTHFGNLQNGSRWVFDTIEGTQDSAFTIKTPNNADMDTLNARLAENFHINDISAADVSELRFMFQVQKFMERSARAGNRYTEFLRANFGVSPRDERLQRPEFIGGTRSPILIQQVLQTSQTNGETTPMATKYGQGMTADSNYSGKYYATEYGVYMPLFVIRPKTSYCQGINRQWIKDTSFDFFNPLFQNLSEQEVYEEEIYTSGVSHNDSKTGNRDIFGFQGRYNEMRHNQNLLTGLMRGDKTYNYWNLGRWFDSAPKLNASFLECKPSKRGFIVTDESMPGFILHIGHKIKALRPLVYMAEPGLIDHH